MVINEDGCSAEGSYTYAPEDLGSSYTLLGFTECLVGMGNNVLNGAVGLTASGGTALFKKDAIVNGPGSFVKADNILAHSTVVIATRILDPATPTLPVMQYNTTSGISGTGVVPSNTTITITEENINLDIGDNCIVTIEGNVYGLVNIGKGCTIVFTTTETIYLTSLEIRSSNSTGPGKISFAGDILLLVKDQVDIGKNTTVNPDGYNVIFFIGEEEPGSLTGVLSLLDEGVVFNASAFVPRGSINTAGSSSSTSSAVITGKFISDKIQSGGKNITWNWRSCEPLLLARPVSPPSLTNEINPQLPLSISCKVFPVPNEGIFTVSIACQAEEIFNIGVYNNHGMKVYESNDLHVKGVYEHTIDLRPVPPGIYVILLESGDEHVIRKIVVR